MASTTYVRLACALLGLSAACSEGSSRERVDALDAEAGAERADDAEAADAGSDDVDAGDQGDAGGEVDAHSPADASLPDAAPLDAAQPDAGAEPGFTAIEGLDAPARARRIGSAHYTTARQLLAHADGSSWLYWHSYPDPTFLGGTAHLQQFSSEGVLLDESALVAVELDNVFLTHDGQLRGWRSRCGESQVDVCFYRESAADEVVEQRWSMSARSSTRYQLDWDGAVVDTAQATFSQRFLFGAASATGRTYALTQDGAYQLHALDAALGQVWALELLPPVMPPEIPLDAPLEQLLKAGDLARQGATELVALEDGVLVALAVGRGSLTALNQARSLQLPLPDDPLCSDILLIRVSGDGKVVRHWVAPTPRCEALPKLTLVGRRAYVASWVHRDRPPEPNDTYEYDVGLSVFELDGDAVHSRLIDMREDDIPYGIARCGERACLAGLSGSRTVNTGSTVTYGDGFILPLTPEGAPDGPAVKLTSPRHSEIRQVAAGGAALLFYATSDGPITHTAEVDRWLGYNRGWLGKLDFSQR